MANTPTTAGVIGFFDTPDALVTAMGKVRDANYQSFDAFTPYPVHGLDAAQGLKRSPIPWVTFFMAMTGTTLAFALQYWTSVIDWPLIVGGKPFNSWPAFVPIMFELTVLLGGVSTFLSVFVFCRLPNTSTKAFDPSLTRDRFCIFIEKPADNKVSPKFKSFDENEATQFLKTLGSSETRKVQYEGWF